MKNLTLSGLCFAGLVALATPEVLAHGGQYRGPGDVVPPSPGGGRGTGGPGGPSTGGPAGPSAPAPGGPATPGAGGPSTGGPAAPGGAPGGGPTTGGPGMAIEDDLTRWEFWWEFNKDPYIRLREAVHQGGTQTGSDDYFLGGARRGEAKDSLKPTEEQIMGEILPALKKAVDDTLERDFDIISSCLIAMAKVGKDHPDFKLVDVFAPRLKANNQEIRESAALAMGIAAIPGETQIELLSGLALDGPAGRKACDGPVNERTRTFATYGLGLLAYRTNNLATKKAAFDAFKQIINDEKESSRNMRVAGIQGMSLLNLDSSIDADKALLAEAVKVLEEYYMKPLGSGLQILQSHCPTAIAKLIGRNHEQADRFKELFAADLLEKGKVKRNSDDIFRSCVMALGQLVKPWDEKDEKKNPDVKYCEILLDTFRKHKDQQTKFFSILALGQIGGEQARNTILKEFDKANKGTTKPWCAIALGIYSHHKYEEQKKVSGGTPQADRGIGETLFDAFKKETNPNMLGSLAIAMGLNLHNEAADAMREMMLAKIPQEDLAGYLCIGLALMNDTRSKETIRDVVKNAIRRFDLLKQGAIALGKLGDKSTADMLKDMLMEEGSNLAKLSALASALGFIGDQRTITPLRTMLLDKNMRQLPRAFAAVALGGVADKELLPWNSKIAINTNYRAAVETLTNRQSGILDIL